MKTWNDYKQHIKSTDPIIAKNINEIEEQVEIISALINRRNELGLSQRELAKICGIPQSSVARIEAYKTTPNLSTLIKIFRPLGLKLKVLK